MGKKAKEGPRTCEDCGVELSGLDLNLCAECSEARNLDGCIEGMECPRCGHTEDFHISFMGQATASKDGSEDDGDHEWDGDSHCECGSGSCSYAGIVNNFSRKDPEWIAERKLALARLEGKEPPVGFKAPADAPTEKYTVTIMRLLPQYLRIPVHATDAEDAKAKAMEIAPNRDFRDGTTGDEAEYQVGAVEKID